MKSERLIEIINVLRKEEKTTAPLLAEKLGVSRRTVNRDIDELCRAGIPIETQQGIGGGIIPGKGFFSFSDSDILARISGADTDISDNGNEPSFGNIRSALGEELSEKAELIKKAAEARAKVKFTYYSPAGAEEITAEPYYTAVRADGLYLCGYSRGSASFGFYALSRICDLTLTGEKFEPRRAPAPDTSEKKQSGDIIITALYNKSEAYRLVEKYGKGSFVPMGKGLYSKLAFDSRESAVSWFLSFGEKVKILSPEDFKMHLMQEAAKILAQYR